MAKANNKLKQGFARCTYNINVGNDTPKIYEKGIQYTEKDQWEEFMKEKFDLHQINET